MKNIISVISILVILVVSNVTFAEMVGTQYAAGFALAIKDPNAVEYAQVYKVAEQMAIQRAFETVKSDLCYVWNLEVNYELGGKYLFVNLETSDHVIIGKGTPMVLAKLKQISWEEIKSGVNGFCLMKRGNDIVIFLRFPGSYELEQTFHDPLTTTTIFKDYSFSRSHVDDKVDGIIGASYAARDERPLEIKIFGKDQRNYVMYRLQLEHDPVKDEVVDDVNKRIKKVGEGENK